MEGRRIEIMDSIDVECVEFVPGGNTLWVQSMNGTVLRIKCTGEVKIHNGCTNNIPHADIMVDGDIEMCMPNKEWKQI
jgi:hypothetical protein